MTSHLQNRETVYQMGTQVLGRNRLVLIVASPKVLTAVKLREEGEPDRGHEITDTWSLSLTGQYASSSKSIWVTGSIIYLSANLEDTGKDRF